MSNSVTMPETKTKRVLVFCLSGLGDAILASPALAALAREPDRFRLTLVTMFPSVAEYLRSQKFTDDVRQIEFLGMSKRQILKRALPLRRERFDVSVVPYAMNRLGYNILSRVVGARFRIGFRYLRQGLMNCPWLNHSVLNEDPSLHAVQENLRWASLLTGRDPSELGDEMLYVMSDDNGRAADSFLRDNGLVDAQPLIGIHAGCNSLKNQHMRCWPPDRFGSLVQRLVARWPRARFLLFEGPTDVAMNAVLLESSGPCRDAITVARRLPMPVVASLVRRCQLFLTNDSGLMHTAVACKTPMVAIYGPTNPVWDGPWKTRSIVVSRDLPCSPCFYYSSRPLSCPAGLDYACVRELPVDNVETAIVKLMSETEAPQGSLR